MTAETACVTVKQLMLPLRKRQMMKRNGRSRYPQLRIISGILRRLAWVKPVSFREVVISYSLV